MYQEVRFDPAVVAAAMRGNQAALDGLVRACLPLVYNIVGRSMGGHADVDDVVQETMLHAVRGLRGLRDPQRFRPWLVAIAIQQVRGQWRTSSRWPRRADLDVDVSDPGADFVDLTIARLGLQGQRREVAEATRWLDEDDRHLLSLWWLEAAGELTRAELAGALGLTPQQATVLVQRMRAQLDAARAIVRALRASPRCAQLDYLARDWDGRPATLWRKRFARHTRECGSCADGWIDLVPADRLLVGLSLVPLPVGFALPALGAGTHVLGHAVGGHSSGWFAKVGSVLSAKPAAAAAAAVLVVSGGAVAAYGAGAFEAPSSGAASTSFTVSASAQPTATASATPSASASPTSGGTSTKRFMGSSRILIGAAMEDASAKAAPWDLRYVYVHSQPAQSSSWYTAARCQDAWTGWWGCWTGSTTAPGTYVTYRLDQAAKATYQGRPRPQKFFFTWYSLRGLGEAAGKPDGPEEVVAINRLDLLTRYLNDYRFFLQKIGKSHAAIDLEPDFWGFARSLGNLHQVPAQVKGANPKDCGSQENSAAGLARCLIAMTRKYAPNTAVGLHLTCFDWEWSIQKCVKDYADLGAKNGDFLVTDVSDRDAGWYALPAHGSRKTFWTDQKAAAALRFYKTMAESVGRPVVLWQIPVGNMAQNNTPGHYKDDKVDWFFGHMDQVAKAHVAALLFGAGWTEQTTPETDGGNLIRKTIAYNNSGGVALK